jgi:hypothetical protein
MVVRERAVCLFAAFAAACATGAYPPCPVEVDGELPPDAFARCAEVLQHAFGLLLTADREQFELRTAWAPSGDLVGERRAVVRTDASGAGLLVRVELRRLTVPWFGLPRWTEPRVDPAAERALAEALAAALRTAR